MSGHIGMAMELAKEYLRVSHGLVSTHGMVSVPIANDAPCAIAMNGLCVTGHETVGTLAARVFHRHLEAALREYRDVLRAGVVEHLEAALRDWGPRERAE